MSSGLAFVGDLARVQRVRELAARLRAGATDNPAATVFGCLSEASIAILLGEPEKAPPAIDQGQAAATSMGIPIWNHLLDFNGALGSFLSGDLEGGRVYLARLAEGAPVSGRLGRAQHAELSAFASLLEGKLELGVVQAEGAVRLSTELGALTYEAASRLLLAELQLALGNADAAELALAPLYDRRELAPSRLFDAQISFAQIDLAALRGSPTASAHAARRAFSSAARSGIGLLASALVTPEAMLRRCYLALDEGIEVDTVCRLLRARGPGEVAPPPWLESWPWSVKIQLLGRLRIHIDGVELESKSKPQVRVLELLQLLVLAGGACSEATIVDALWPEADGDQAQQALSIAVHRLRVLLGDASIVERRAGELSLDRKRVFADVWAIEALLDNASRATSERRVTLLGAARKLLAGPPAAVRKGDSPSWLIDAERRLSQRFLS